jgi:hypothetical protein
LALIWHYSSLPRKSAHPFHSSLYLLLGLYGISLGLLPPFTELNHSCCVLAFIFFAYSFASSNVLKVLF